MDVKLAPPAGTTWAPDARMDGKAPPGHQVDHDNRFRPKDGKHVAWSACNAGEAPECAPLDCYADPEMPDCDQVFVSPGDKCMAFTRDEENGTPTKDTPRQGQLEDPVPMDSTLSGTPSPASQIPCTANGKRPVESDFRHCPIPQSFVRCGPHHRSEINALEPEDVERLYDIWKRYQDDLTWPWYDKKPHFSDQDFATFTNIAEKVVNVMVEEYGQPMVLDQATISNTNHKGHPPHADNVQFDSVWWEGKRIRQEDEVVAAQEGAYVLWRSEKTSYRSYSASVSLCDPNGYEGGEVQFFNKWGDKDPIASVKCESGKGVAFCGCSKNIHAVTGVRSGWRLVFLVWTRPPHVRVPEQQTHVCYFRPGTGLGVWLTTADQQRPRESRGNGKRDWETMQTWVPKEDEDSDCNCEKCRVERKKLSWRDCLPMKKMLANKEPSTPSTSVGTSPRGTRDNDSSADAPSGEPDGSGSEEVHSGEEVQCACPRTPTAHCTMSQGMVRCGPHSRVDINGVLAKPDVTTLHKIWKRHQDNLTDPWYDKKPRFSEQEFQSFRAIAQKVVDAMSQQYRQPLVLDQATISNTNHIGHPPHADNVQFDSVWWHGKQLKQRDELVAARGGADVLWRSAKTSYRNYSATVALSDPSEYGGGELEFYSAWGDKEPCVKYKSNVGSGVAFCGCQKNVHAVTGVKWGFRLVLLIWTRPKDVPVPDEERHLCYFRPGTGLSVWLTSQDLEDYPSRRQKRNSGQWVPIVNSSEDGEVEGKKSIEQQIPIEADA